MKGFTSLFICLHLFITVTVAQSMDTILLMQKGAELEYHNYLPRIGMFGKHKGFFEITTLIYTVIDVRDSSGVAIGTVLKNGKAIKNTKRGFKHPVSVRSDGRNMLFAADFYILDSIYLCDLYGRGMKGVYSRTTVKGPSIDYPLNPSLNSELGKHDYDFKISIYDPVAAHVQDFATHSDLSPINKITPSTKAYKNTLTTISRKMAGRETVQVPAGSFDCYKVVVSTETEIQGRRLISIVTEYYTPGIGIVKMEQTGGSTDGGYMELTRIKK